MADRARELTDKRLDLISDRLTASYKSARSELYDKLNKYLSKSQMRLESLTEAYNKALASGDKSAIEKAKKALEQAKINITLNDKRYRTMIDDITDRLADVNKTSLNYVNGQMPYVYRQNYNGAKKAANEVGMDFSLMNEEAVAKLIKNGDIKLPKKKLDIPKDKRWNTKQLNSAVLQGILQGESMDKIAKRILPIVDNNRDAAIRNARTMVTGAENEGRLDGFNKLEEDGAILKKVWIATPDSRTREAHLFLDGQEVDVDKPFIDSDGNELMYPGDPSAEPATVYNCRCSMRTHIIGFRKKDGEVEPVNFNRKSGMHQEAIEKEKEKRIPKEPRKLAITLKDIGRNPRLDRPKASKFATYEEFSKATEEYHIKRDAWDAKVEQFTKEQLDVNPLPLPEFTKWCDDKEIKISGDISGVDNKLLAVYSQRMDQLTKDFPEVLEMRKKMPVEGNAKYYVVDFAANNDSFLAEASHGMTFGAECNNINDILKHQIEDVTDGHRVVGDGTLNQFIDHEFGHNVYRSLWFKNRNWNIDQAYDDEWKQQIRAMKADLLTNVKGEGMSEYAQVNDHERFAEAFSAWYGGEQTEFAKSFGEFLKRWRK